jgi:hypothetical protein
MFAIHSGKMYMPPFYFVMVNSIYSIPGTAFLATSLSCACGGIELRCLIFCWCYPRVCPQRASWKIGRPRWESDPRPLTYPGTLYNPTWFKPRRSSSWTQRSCREKDHQKNLKNVCNCREGEIEGISRTFKFSGLWNWGILKLKNSLLESTCEADFAFWNTTILIQNEWSKKRSRERTINNHYLIFSTLPVSNPMTF